MTTAPATYNTSNATPHYDKAMNLWEQIKLDVLEFGREARLAIQTEGKTIRDFSIDLCGNASLEDRIGRWIMAAEFADSLLPCQYENVCDWLTPTHYTELEKIKAATDEATALDLMQELITENPDGSVNVKPVSWLRAKRDNEQASTEEFRHRFWKSACRMLAEWQSVMERKGKLVTANDKRMLAILKAAVKYFTAEPARACEGRG